jgi:hypothetical protein
MRTFKALTVATLLVPCLGLLPAAQTGFIQQLGSITPPPQVVNHEMTFASAAIEGSLAVVGRFGTGVNVVDISVPAAPVNIMTWQPNSFSCGTVCDQSVNPMAHLDIADVKLKDGIGYFSTNGYLGNCAETAGMYIVDLRPTSNTYGKVLSHITDKAAYGGTGSRNTIAFHTINLRKLNGNEYLFLEGVEDAEPYLNRPAPRPDTYCVESERYLKQIRVFNVNNKSNPVFKGIIKTKQYVHDASFIEKNVGGVVKTFLVTSGFRAPSGCDDIAGQTAGCTEFYDITNMDDPLLYNNSPFNSNSKLYTQFNSGKSTHSSAATEDAKYLFVSHEILDEAAGTTPSGKLSVYSMDLSAPKKTPVWKYDFNPASYGISTAPNVHEPYVQGSLLFTSWYEGGVNIFDIANPLAPVLYAYAPGTKRTFDGNTTDQGSLDLAAYSSLARIVTSDREGGLKIFSILDATPMLLLLN